MARLQALLALGTLGAGLAATNIYRLSTDGHEHRTVTYVVSYAVGIGFVGAMLALTIVLARRRDTGTEPTPIGRLRDALRVAQRDGKALAGEAASLDPIGNLELVDDLVRRYNDYEGRVADQLAATDALDSRWQLEWLRPDQHANIGPLTREELDRLAQVIGRRARLIDGMIRELEGRR